MKCSLEDPPTNGGIVLAADFASLDELTRLAELASTFPQVVALKVGFHLALVHGLARSVEAVRSASLLPVIYDHQKAGTDIPQMAKPFASICRDAGVQSVIIFGQAGPQTLEEFVLAARDCGLLAIVGLTMSHPRYLASEGGYIADDAPDRICRLALQLGVNSFVLPGNKPATVARFAKDPLSGVKGVTVFMPGIGSQGGSLQDAFSAAEPHTPVAIIGSAIYAAEHPGQALARFVQMVPQWQI